ncbi:acyl-CoA ligase (AMP-forming), exosortase A system-associated [uncultured Lamprocystis sp.]|jgi:acyl-CoA ligase (AMP-forming) (exosortase A-associated)|uniref:acyl-CoA ligase (AMP-forming), exosortase A system-associated n=1 Tax=uncultured Lamprocystis sp. TaxID=543132 RepID=UPI0025F189DC|nr:acyl-CoA ligase (AMP-forming), exosortase A system-associated [uncultured Lamprocystis sp.]
MQNITLVHELVHMALLRSADRDALVHRTETLSYRALWRLIGQWRAGLLRLGLDAGDRVGVYLPKTFDTPGALFGTAAAGGCFVPLNPLIKPFQVAHILHDCNARILVTSVERAKGLVSTLTQCPDLRQVVLVDGSPTDIAEPLRTRCVGAAAILDDSGGGPAGHRRIDTDLAAILYTSGSTGAPKGVVLSHRNLIAGALSVAGYLENRPEDRLLAVLPLSFDYGLSQLTTAFAAGAAVVLMDYLLPTDVIRAVTRYGITGLAAVPPLWTQVAGLDWPQAARTSLRYLTNSGGSLPAPTLQTLRSQLPNTRIYLMYGLTEAFRSTYLPPDQIDTRPDSIGKAIPNAEVLVVREDGSQCEPDEPGELVHRGALVSLGYWNDPARTRERFRPAPGQPDGLPNPELAVWSGDQVRRDADGYLYFIGRRDEQIKTSGYRVSPTEVEEVVYRSGLVAEAVAIGIPHGTLGQAILVVATATAHHPDLESRVIAHCRDTLPGFMVPQRVLFESDLPRNPNGKIDRTLLASRFENLFRGEPAR